MAKPYSVGFDGVYPRLRKEEVERTLDEVFATFATMIRAVCAKLGVEPTELNVGQVGRALVGRPAVDPGSKHDVHVTKPIFPCNTQSAADDTKCAAASPRHLLRTSVLPPHPATEMHARHGSAALEGRRSAG